MLLSHRSMIGRPSSARADWLHCLQKSHPAEEPALRQATNAAVQMALREPSPSAVRFRALDQEDSPGADTPRIRDGLHAAEHGKILKMLGFSPQRPLWHALERDPEKRREWTEETFPAIKKRADQEGAKIFFADSSYCRTDHHAGTTWAPVGQTPVAEHVGSREGIGMISAVSTRGELHWMIYTESMNSALFTDYLRYLIEDVEGKIFLISDRARYTVA